MVCAFENELARRMSSRIMFLNMWRVLVKQI
jgi:hypothetical protein